MTGVPALLYLNREAIRELGGECSDLYVEAVARAFELHARGQYVQPLKPYLRSNAQGGHIADRIIAMPAHLDDGAPMSGIKWIGSKHDNPAARGLERASGVIVLNDPLSNYPVAILEAGLISGMRTAAVTVIGARLLANPRFRQVSCLGCGAIARMQMIAMLEQFPAIRLIRLYDRCAEAAERLAAELCGRFDDVEVKVAGDAEEAVRGGEVIVTCTVADQSYIPFEWISKGAFISNISIMDLHKEVFLRADKVVVDDWEQSNREKKTINQLVLEGSFSREQLHAELGEIIIGRKPGRESEEEVIVLNPMGMAIQDISSAQAIYRLASQAGKGTLLSLYGAEPIGTGTR
ncbi:2,3-diaminopropionate biosynthesis protein SbnB [Paenibacillus oenotherae]|uniref:2,3-diaminopropionate biosynthesis protein SbnB n=1 Tax=Paenibacillus oenotherae TaxID=1435645 RepID=A0ABS7D0A6_9BACL|nr:2,3-diaminopropionate biosynthesis protein SbnB [Paenibacillus oenotherae]MBW7473357.1 2,3-diaminopropionate biosynthesis protein SbnB [Paenibacillus oenotherae]